MLGKICLFLKWSSCRGDKSFGDFISLNSEIVSRVESIYPVQWNEFCFGRLVMISNISVKWFSNWEGKMKLHIGELERSEIIIFNLRWCSGTGIDGCVVGRTVGSFLLFDDDAKPRTDFLQTFAVLWMGQGVDDWVVDGRRRQTFWRRQLEFPRPVRWCKSDYPMYLKCK